MWSYSTQKAPRPSLHLLNQDQLIFFYFCCCHYTRLCGSCLQLYHPVLFNCISVYVAYLTSCRNYCRRATAPTLHQTYFQAVPSLSFQTVYLTHTVLLLDSCRLALGLEKNFVRKSSKLQRSQDATWSFLLKFECDMKFATLLYLEFDWNLNLQHEKRTKNQNAQSKPRTRQLDQRWALEKVPTWERFTVDLWRGPGSGQQRIVP